MRRPPTSGISGALLAILLSVPLLGAEVGHSLAHHHAADHHHTAQPAGSDHDASGAPAEIALTDHQHDDDHPHVNIAATLLVKPSLHSLHSVIVAPDVPQYSDERTLVLPSQTIGPSPGGQFQAHPPPSRAPPQV